MIAAALALVVAAVFAFVTLVGDDGDDATSPEAADLADLQDLADSVNHRVYWAGPQEGKTYELTVTDEGNIYVRYLDPDVPVGSEGDLSLTIGTYPTTNAYDALTQSAEQPGATTAATPDGGLVVTHKSNPQSAYVAYPETDLQIEIFDPNPKVALATATSGAIEPIE